MKTLLTTAMILLLACGARAQTNNVGINTPNPDASAALDVTSTSQGMLIPRMNQAQRNMINLVGGVSTPATGLLIYQTDNTPGFYFYNGTAWVTLTGATGAQGPTGPQGPAGATGATGAQGTAGQGVPAGGTAGQVLTKVDATNYNTQWTTPGGSGASVQVVATKTSSTQTLPLSQASPDIVSYNNVVTTPTLGTFSTTDNSYTVGSNGAGVYLIQTRNSMSTSPSGINNTLGAYNWLEVNGAAIGSYTNIYPSYISNVSSASTTNSALKSSSSYLFLVSLSAGDVVRIRATGANSGVVQVLNNDGGTQIMIVKL